MTLKCDLLWAGAITNGWKYEISLAVKWCINNINGRADHEAAHITRTQFLFRQIYGDWSPVMILIEIMRTRELKQLSHIITNIRILERERVETYLSFHRPYSIHSE